MRKIDKTLREVRAIKRKLSLKTKNMNARQAVAYFRASRQLLAKLHRRPKPA